MFKRLWVLPILAIVVIAAVSVACGGGNEKPSATRTAGASPTATRPAAASPTRPATTATPGATRTPAAASPTHPAATATPAAGAAQIDVAAQGFAFDKKTLEVKAGEPFTIRLENKDSVTHNLHIFTKKGGDSIAVTDPEAVSGGKTGTLTATITQPGDYYFQCDFHPGQMNGTLTVK